MKTIVSGLLALLVAGHAAQAQGKINLRITTERQSKSNSEIKKQGSSEQKDVKSNTIYVSPTVRETTQDVTYLIKIQNMGQGASGLIVKYAIFGRDRASLQVQPTVQGQETVDIKSLQTQAVKTKPAHFAATVAQYDYDLGDRKQGSDCYGIGVTVYFGDARVATFYDPPGLEHQAGKANTGL